MSALASVRDSRLESLFNALAGDAIRKNEIKGNAPETQKDGRVPSSPVAPAIPPSLSTLNSVRGEANESRTVLKSEAWILDLDLSFSPEALQKTLNSLTATAAGSREAAPAPANEILTTGFSADGAQVEKTKISEGNGTVRDINTYEYRKTERRVTSDYRIDRIKLSIQRREREETEARLSVSDRNGYRIVYKRLSQRYQDSLSLRAELLSKFTSGAAAVEKNAPESTGAFIETTGKLAEEPAVTGKTISAFFDAVEAHFDASRAALHAKIDTFLERLTKDLNLSEDEMKQAGKLLHERVDSFFGEVNHILDGMEKANLAAIGEGNAVAPAANQSSNSEMENSVVNV